MSIPLLSPVALIEDLPDQKLTRGQIGTVVEYLSHDVEHAMLVEFSDDQGRTIAIAELQPSQVIVLHRHTQAA